MLYNDSLTREDEKAVLNQVPSVLYSSPILEMHERISFGGGVVKDTLVMGVSPEYKNVRNLMVLAGRFFDDEDEKAHIKCAVVTMPFAIQMFGSSDEAIGRDFQIQGIPVPHCRHIQGKRGHVRAVGDHRQHHPDSLFGSALIQRH